MEIEFVLNIKTKIYFEKRGNAKKELIYVMPNYKKPLQKDDLDNIAREETFFSFY